MQERESFCRLRFLLLLPPPSPSRNCWAGQSQADAALPACRRLVLINGTHVASPAAAVQSKVGRGREQVGGNQGIIIKQKGERGEKISWSGGGTGGDKWEKLHEKEMKRVRGEK